MSHSYWQRGFSRATLGRYAGIGVEVAGVGDSTYAAVVHPGTPGARAGLRRGDRFVVVDGVPVDGMPIDSVVRRLRGAPGTTVRLTMARRGRADPLQLDLQRAAVQLPGVAFTLLERGIAYVPVPAISGTAGTDVRRAVQRAAQAGARGLVLDLRGNGGGAVDQAVEMASAFLPEGSSVLEIRERAGTMTLRTELPPVAPGVPVVVLQDEGSASAAEIVAGALQDHDRAMLVGARTYGKGLAQSVFPLQGGWALKMTTSRWYTPVGRSIHRDRSTADSARAHTVEDAKAGAEHRSDAGRVLAGGGGITPDLAIAADTLSADERALATRLAADAPIAARVLGRVAFRLAQDADSGFGVTPAWRETLRRDLAAAGVPIDSAHWAGGADYVRALLEGRVADFASGRAEARRRMLAHDRQFQVADSLLRDARSAVHGMVRGARS